MTTVLVVGDTPRAIAWTKALARAQLVDSVTRIEAEPHAIRHALLATPSATLAIDAGAELSENLAALAAALGARGIVSAAPQRVLPRGFLRALDFESAPAVAWLAKHLQGATALRVQLNGSADGQCEDVREVVLIGASIVRALVPSAEVETVSLVGGSEVHVSWSGLAQVLLIANSHGSSMQLHAESRRTQVDLFVDAETERRILHTDGKSQSRSVVLPPALAWTLAPLRAEPPAAPTPAGQAAVVAPITAALALLPPAPNAFRTLRKAVASAPELDLAWTLTAALKSAACPEQISEPSGASLLELLAFEAGVKPALLLARSAREAELLSRRFPHSHTLPTPGGVIWLAARTAEDLAELVRLRSAEDPDKHLAEIGALLGYPTCCVRAFSQLSDRSDDARSRYVSALATTAPAPWPWQLNNSSVRTIPFFPCSYGCAAAVKQANAVLKVLREASPAEYQRLKEHLAATTFFFDEGLFIRVETQSSLERRVALPAGAPPWLQRIATTLATPGVLQVTRERLSIVRDGVMRAELTRRLPWGVWMPFGR